LLPATKNVLDSHEPDFRKLVRKLGLDLLIVDAIAVLSQNTLSLFGIEKVQIVVGELGRPTLFCNLVNNRDREFREQADRRHHRVEPVDAEFSGNAARFCLERDDDVADLALNECRSGSATARIEHRNV